MSAKNLLNYLLFGIILSIPLQGSPFAQFSSPKTSKNMNKNSWKSYSYEKNGFSIELPEKPEHVEQSITIPKTDLQITYDTYLSEPSDSSVYVISVWKYPPEIDMSSPEINLKDGFSGMLSALPGSKVLNMNMGTLQGYNTLEFLVQNEDIYFQGKLILVHNTLYQVFTVYKNSSENMTDNYVQFIDSFKLLSPEKNNTYPTNSKKKNSVHF